MISGTDCNVPIVPAGGVVPGFGGGTGGSFPGKTHNSFKNQSYSSFFIFAVHVLIISVEITECLRL